MFSSSLVGPGSANTALLVLPSVARCRRANLSNESRCSATRWQTYGLGDRRGRAGWLGRRHAGCAGRHRDEGVYFARLAEATPVPAPTEPRVADVRHKVMGSRSCRSTSWATTVRSSCNMPGPRVMPGALLVWVEPRTALVRLGRDLPAPEPYFLHEEDVPRAGIVVHRVFRGDGQRPDRWSAGAPDYAGSADGSAPWADAAEISRRHQGGDLLTARPRAARPSTRTQGGKHALHPGTRPARDGARAARRSPPSTWRARETPGETWRAAVRHSCNKERLTRGQKRSSTGTWRHTGKIAE